MATATRRLPAAVVGILLIAALFAAYSSRSAFASHEPANKVAAAGSDIDHVTDNTVILDETVKVSTTHDLILSVSAECSILTSLLTDDTAVGDEEEPPGTSAFAFGSVRLRLTIDGFPVPVASAEGVGEDDAADDDDQPGEVTFCNRAYQRTVSDTENDNDGVDRQDDFIRTRTANAFNWMALDVGVDDPGNANGFAGYDDPAIAGNNIVEIKVIADYDVDPTACEEFDNPDNSSTPLGRTCADAFVGSRTLIAEPTNASIHEAVNQTDPGGTR